MALGWFWWEPYMVYKNLSLRELRVVTDHSPCFYVHKMSLLLGIVPKYSCVSCGKSSYGLPFIPPLIKVYYPFPSGRRLGLQRRFNFKKLKKVTAIPMQCYECCINTSDTNTSVVSLLWAFLRGKLEMIVFF